MHNFFGTFLCTIQIDKLGRACDLFLRGVVDGAVPQTLLQRPLPGGGADGLGQNKFTFCLMKQRNWGGKSVNEHGEYGVKFEGAQLWVYEYET